MDKDKKPKHSPPESLPANASEMEELFRRLQPEMRGRNPGTDAIAAALEAAQRLAAETDAEDSANDIEQDLMGGPPAVVCAVCGYHNRGANKFCGMCGLPVATPAPHAVHPEPELPPARGLELPPNPFSLEPEARPMANRGTGFETHHYHHHYHHHYFPGGQEAMGVQGMGTQSMGTQGMLPRSAPESVRDPEKLRPNAALRGDMSRAEAAVRRITHEWVLACNTKHLDDLLDLYVADALVLRSNYPPVRGAAAVREFFFGALDAGLGEVEVEPLRVDVLGDMAYEAGRCKALVPSATGKRREERGKYLWVCVRQGNGEWKLAADCWSSDLTFTAMESDVPPNTGVKSSQPRKT